MRLQESLIIQVFHNKCKIQGTVNGTSGIAWFAIAGIAIADKAYNTAYVTGTVPPGTFKT